MEYLEVHVEHLLGRRVFDADGRKIGRIEEFHVEIVDGEFVVTEYHVGPAAFLERAGAFIMQLPFFRYLPFTRHGYRVPWAQLDLSDVRRPRLVVRRDELATIDLKKSAGEG